MFATTTTRTTKPILAALLALSACEEKGDPPEATTAVNTTANDGEDNSGTEPPTTPSSTSSSSSGDGDGTDTTTFVPDKPDDIAECDPLAQDCPEGEKCVPYANDGGNVWNANKCVPVTGNGQQGDPCTSSDISEATDDCGVDTVCWNVSDGVGTCTSFCEGPSDAPFCDPGYNCVIGNDGVITVCLQQCDPVLQDCASELICYWFAQKFSCLHGASEQHMTGEPCGFANDCEKGNTCASAEVVPDCTESACCAAFCDLDNPACEIEKTECVSFFEEGEAPPGYEHVGVCIVPGA